MRLGYLLLVGSAGWNNEAWVQVRDYDRYWASFNARFHFRPGMASSTWPAIEEPAGSVTFDLSPIFDRDERGASADIDAVNECALVAFTEVFPKDCRLVALDWQHASYWFWPHRQATLEEPWRITVFPDADYYIFLTEDLTQGTFAHPWEQTLCVFGRDLTAALAPRLADWLPVKRSKPA